jgi:hypothetical protein
MSMVKEVITTGVYVFEHQIVMLIPAFILAGVILGIYKLLQLIIKENGQ